MTDLFFNEGCWELSNFRGIIATSFPPITIRIKEKEGGQWVEVLGEGHGTPIVLRSTLDVNHTDFKSLKCGIGNQKSLEQFVIQNQLEPQEQRTQEFRYVIRYGITKHQLSS